MRRATSPLTVRPRNRFGRTVLGLIVGIGLTTLPAWARAAEAPAKAPPAKAGAAPAEQPAATNRSFDEMPFDQGMRQEEPKVREIRQRETKLDDEKRALLEKFYRLYSLSRWTQGANYNQIIGPPNPQSRDHPNVDAFLLNKGFRRELRQDLQITKGEVHDGLNAIILKILDEMASGNYRLTARVNAMLAIGELNSTEPTPAARDGIPLPAALPVMLAAVTKAEQIDAVRVAALVGIQREVKAKVVPANDPNYGPLVDAMKAIVAGKDVPADRTPEGDGWIRAQAAEILGDLGNLGSSGAVAEDLGGLAGNAAVALLARRAAAMALGQLNYNSGGVPDATNLAKSLMQFTIDACKAEENDVLQRRRIKDRLTAAQIGLNGVDQEHKGVKSAVGDAGRPLLAIFEPTLQSMIEAVDSRNDDSSVLEKLKTLRTKLQDAIK